VLCFVMVEVAWKWHVDVVKFKLGSGVLEARERGV
jgi:hypothetical protein